MSTLKKLNKALASLDSESDKLAILSIKWERGELAQEDVPEIHQTQNFIDSLIGECKQLLSVYEKELEESLKLNNK